MLSALSRALRAAYSKALNFYDSATILWLLILLGIAARLAQYLYNRSLWVDEAALAVAIVTTPFSELLKPLIYNQAAPIGFLVLMKCLTQIFGYTEYTLRSIPFLCAIASLFIFLKVANLVCHQRAVPIALCMFSCSTLMINYSNEFKQYSSDVFFTLALLLVALKGAKEELTLKRVGVLSMAGILAIWFSHPALFVLAGIGITLAGATVLSRDWRRLSRLAIVGTTWIASFGLNYYATLGSLSKNDWMYRFWRHYFAPFPPTNARELGWLAEHFTQWFRESGVVMEGVVLAFLLLGIISLFSKERVYLFMLISPLFFLLVASGWKVFPMATRLILFVIPILYLVVSTGVQDLRLASLSRSGIASGVLAVILLYGPLHSAMGQIVEPRLYEESRSAIDFIRQGWRDGDKLYVFRGAKIAFHYYGNLRYRISETNVVIGSGPKKDRSGYERDLEKLHSAGRVWFLFSNVKKARRGEINEEGFYLQILDQMGKRVDEFHIRGASAYLYEL